MSEKSGQKSKGSKSEKVARLDNHVKVMRGEVKELRGKLIALHDMLTRISNRTDEFARDFRDTTDDFVDFQKATGNRFAEEKKMSMDYGDETRRRLNEFTRKVNDEMKLQRGREDESRAVLASLGEHADRGIQRIENETNKLGESVTERFKTVRVDINDLQSAVADIRESLKSSADFDDVSEAHAQFRDQQLDSVAHKSDCSLHNEPAYAARPCDCGALQLTSPESIRLKCIEIASHATSYKHPDDVLKDAAAYERAVLHGFGSSAGESESEPSTDAPEKDVELCNDSGLCVLPKGHPGALHSTKPDKHTDVVNWGDVKKSEGVCMRVAMRGTGATKATVICSRSRDHIGQHYDKHADIRWDGDK